MVSLINNIERELEELRMLAAHAIAANNCMICDNFDQVKEVCKFYNARPPAKIIVVGCEKFCADIPF